MTKPTLFFKLNVELTPDLQVRVCSHVTFGECRDTPPKPLCKVPGSVWWRRVWNNRSPHSHHWQTHPPSQGLFDGGESETTGPHIHTIGKHIHRLRVCLMEASLKRQVPTFTPLANTSTVSGSVWWRRVWNDRSPHSHHWQTHPPSQCLFDGGESETTGPHIHTIGKHIHPLSVCLMEASLKRQVPTFTPLANTSTLSGSVWWRRVWNDRSPHSHHWQTHPPSQGLFDGGESETTGPHIHTIGKHIHPLSVCLMEASLKRQVPTFTPLANTSTLSIAQDSDTEDNSLKCSYWRWLWHNLTNCYIGIYRKCMYRLKPS